MELLKRRIDVAAGRAKADLVIANGTIIDVFTGTLYQADVAVADGYFVGIGTYEGNVTIDATGKYLCPSFIDGHVHLESSMVTPKEFAKVSLLHGVTTAICDPHEIANVLGVKGIEYLLTASEHLPFDAFFMLPSCVPATSFELAGATLTNEDLKPLYEHPRVLGLGEVMDFQAVCQGKPSMLEKLANANQLGVKIDGHGAGLAPADINVYAAVGIRSDHESTRIDEAMERMRRGLYVMIREGTVARDAKALLPLVTERNARRCLFVTDDKHLDDLIEEGSIDYLLRLAIEMGIDPITAIQMASLNTAECFGLSEKGAIAPGYQADFLLLNDLRSLTISHVFKDGICVMNDGEFIEVAAVDGISGTRSGRKPPTSFVQSVHFGELCTQHVQLPVRYETANVLGIIPNQLLTNHLVEKVAVNKHGLFMPSVEDDFLKIAVIERHHYTEQIGVGIVKGLGLKAGAIASTVAHDSHNLVVAAVNDSDLLFAVNELKRMQGGLVVVRDGQILASLPLPIAGLLSEASYLDVYEDLRSITAALDTLGVSGEFNPFLTLSFLALPVIPTLKITAQGLYDVNKQQFIGV